MKLKCTGNTYQNTTNIHRLEWIGNMNTASYLPKENWQIRVFLSTWEETSKRKSTEWTIRITIGSNKGIPEKQKNPIKGNKYPRRPSPKYLSITGEGQFRDKQQRIQERRKGNIWICTRQWRPKTECNRVRGILRKYWWQIFSEGRALLSNRSHDRLEDHNRSQQPTTGRRQWNHIWINSTHR